MNLKKEKWVFALFSILLIQASLSSCSNRQQPLGNETILLKTGLKERHSFLWKLFP